MTRVSVLLAIIFLALGIQVQAEGNGKTSMSMDASTKLETAYFAAGCFWKVQHVFSKVPGVVETRVGYTGGHVSNPNYELVCGDKTGHAEAVKVSFDPAKVSYKHLLEVFWTNHNPTTKNRQGLDIGTQYRSAVFYTTPEQQRQATEYKEQLDKTRKFGLPIVTEIAPAKPFFDAEEYHQNYFAKHGAVCY